MTAAWTIAKTAAEISKKLFELGKTLKDREAKQHVDEIVDSLRDLKHRASDLEDENRELRDKLRFKSDDYNFATRTGITRRTQRKSCAQSVLRRVLLQR